MENSHLLTVDEPQMIAKICELHRQLLPQLEDSEALVNQLLPYYRRIYDRCRQQPIDPTILASG
jgi:hypothetical protein